MKNDGGHFSSLNFFFSLSKLDYGSYDAVPPAFIDRSLSFVLIWPFSLRSPGASLISATFFSSFLYVSLSIDFRLRFALYRLSVL